MNTVMVLGNLATPVEVKPVGKDKTVGKFLLALSRYGQRERSGPDFVRVVCWGPMAVNAGTYLQKGSRVCVVGRLESQFYEKRAEKKTETRLNTEIVADQIEYLSSPKQVATIASASPGARK